MTPAHLRRMRQAGMGIGAHTRSHPHLDRLPPELHAEEVSGSRADLEQILEEPVTDFAYPNPGGGGEALPPARASVEKAGLYGVHVQDLNEQLETVSPPSAAISPSS